MGFEIKLFKQKNALFLVPLGLHFFLTRLMHKYKDTAYDLILNIKKGLQTLHENIL